MDLASRTILEPVSITLIFCCPRKLSIPVIITRGLSEMTRIGTAYGASPLTFLGLAGVGDLFLTCSSSNSRNYTVGYRLGQGEKLDVIMSTLGSVAEGVPTTKGVKQITDELEINAPIADAASPDILMSLKFTNYFRQVYDVLFNGEPETRIFNDGRAHTRVRKGHTASRKRADGAPAFPRAGAAVELRWGACSAAASEAGD